MILDGGNDSTVSGLAFALQGTRLAVEVQTVSFMGPVAPALTEVGWIDLRGGPARFGLLNVLVDPVFATPDDPMLPDDKVGFAIAPDGSMAVIGGAKSGCQVVAMLAIRTRRSVEGYRLGAPVVLYSAPRGGLAPTSLTIDASTVTWKTTSGLAGSAPRSTGTPAVGSVLARTGGC